MPLGTHSAPTRAKKKAPVGAVDPLEQSAEESIEDEDAAVEQGNAQAPWWLAGRPQD